MADPLTVQLIMEHVLDLSLGAIEVAVLLASVLYGLVLIQTYVYALSCKSDRPALKLVVALIAYVDISSREFGIAF